MRYRDAVWLVIWIAASIGCKEQKPPIQGSFPVKVTALTPDRVGIPGARVMLNGKELGETDAFGTYVGIVSGRVGAKVKLRVVGPGENNALQAQMPLKMQRAGGFWRPVTLRYEAFLRPALKVVAYRPPPKTPLASAPPRLTPQPEPPPQIPPAREGSSRASSYHIAVESNARVWVYRGSKRLAQLRDPKTRMLLRVRVKGLPPGPLQLRFRPVVANRYLQKELRQSVALEAGRREGYLVKLRFVPAGQIVPFPPSCGKRHRGAQRVVRVRALAGARLYLLGQCKQHALGLVDRQGSLRISMPVGSFQRLKVRFADGQEHRRVFEIQRGSGEHRLDLRSLRGRCQLQRIQKKVRNQIRLERQELRCLHQVKPNNPQYFKARLSLGRHHCSHGKRGQGGRLLAALARKPRHSFHPYRSLQLGMELGHCKRDDLAISLLKRAEILSIRLSARDRYHNRKALYQAMSILYERRYYRRKNAADLVRAYKRMLRLKEHLRPHDKGFVRRTRAEVRRLKKLVVARGGADID